ncbi:MAG TPA: choice-of-anchor Q domain-containing protein, partial [Gammaproteobacteria bacterium]|nr:choice-of-anchor Q domain-containing protein [Gammaproteobacteria bacterium]
LVNILNPTLANNGGPTRTHALVGGSPAIDTVTDGTFRHLDEISAASEGHKMAITMGLRSVTPGRLSGASL